jgi:FkbM family methyltransferase
MCQELFLPEQCYLFEPQVALRLEISKHKPKAGGEWKIFSIALADRDDTSTLYLAKNLAASSLLAPTEGLAANAGVTSTVGQTEVKTIRLDKLVEEGNLRPPNLLKIDVQGFEDRVLAGGAKTIAQAQRIVIEASLRQIYKGQVMLPQLLARLVQLGFELEDISEAYREWPMGTLWQVDLWLKRKQ